MKRIDTELFNPLTRMRLRVLESPETTQSRDLLWEATYPPRSPRPPVHYHPVQEEQFEVLSGTMMVRIGQGEARELRMGEILKIPAGTEHSMWNASSSETKMLWRTSPAMGTYGFIRKVFALARDGQTSPGGAPKPLQMAVLLFAYRREMRLAGRQSFHQRLLITLLAQAGRLRGYRAD